MGNLLIVLAAAILLPILLFFEKKELPRRIFVVKLPLSLLFILTAVVQLHPRPEYFYLIFAGLVFCLGGDIFLISSERRWFLMGLVSFLIGHVWYVVAFLYTARLSGITWTALVLVLLVSLCVFFWLRPHLGAMKGPVIAYILIISAMVVGGATMLGDPELSAAGKGMAFIGALLFYVSDIFVARHRFVKKEIVNRFAGLPLYYTGQFLIAFSVGYL